MNENIFRQGAQCRMIIDIMVSEPCNFHVGNVGTYSIMPEASFHSFLWVWMHMWRNGLILLTEEVPHCVQKSTLTHTFCVV